MTNHDEQASRIRETLSVRRAEKRMGLTPKDGTILTTESGQSYVFRQPQRLSEGGRTGFLDRTKPISPRAFGARPDGDYD